MEETYTFDEVVELLKTSDRRTSFNFRIGTYADVEIKMHREWDYLIVAWGNESYFQKLTAFSGERLERLKKENYKKTQR